MEHLEILYSDEHLVAINKPSGLLVHRSDMDKGETDSCVRLLRDQLGEQLFPLHRLDKPTSGVLLFARTREQTGALMELFATGRVTKSYVALVRGWSEPQGTVSSPLRRLVDRRGRKIVRGEQQEAVTRYETLAHVEHPIPCGPHATTRASVVLVQPESGRYRQIRRHFKHIFHPIVGDTTFGDGATNRHFRTHFHIFRLMLHASEVHIPLPDGPLRITAPLPALFHHVVPLLETDKE